MKGKIWLLAVLLFMLRTVPANSETCACGDTVTTDIVLTGNLNCTGHGIVIGAAGITIDGNGYAINGDGLGNDYGIYNPDGYDSITVKDFGGISNFVNGVNFTNSAGSIIQDNSIHSNLGSGITCTGGNHTTITGNTARMNFGGISLTACTTSVVSNNTVNLNSKNNGLIITTSDSCTISGNVLRGGNSNGMTIASTSHYCTVTNNTVASFRVAYSLSSNTYQNNLFLDNLAATMLVFAETSTAGIKAVNDSVSFSVTAKNTAGSACASCTVITTSPAEASLTYTDNGSGVVTGGFRPQRTGLYSVISTVTDANGNIAKRKYSFLVSPTSAKTATYYYRVTNPTHGQPIPQATTPLYDARSLRFEVPTETEEWLCGVWVQNAVDSLPLYPLARLSSVNNYLWYKNAAEALDDGTIGIQRWGVYNATVDASAAVTLATAYTWVNKNLASLNWTMDYARDWYNLALKNTGDSIYVQTTVAQPSYAVFTYSCPTRPEVLSVSNADVDVVSATSTVADTTHASIVLNNPYPADTSVVLTLLKMHRPFLGYATTIHSDDTTVVTVPIDSSASLTLNTVALAIVPDTSSIAVNVAAWGSGNKAWTETGSIAGIVAAHTISGLKAGGKYRVKVNGALFGNYTANGAGEISFSYNGGYSAKSFSLEDMSTSRCKCARRLKAR